MKFSIWHLLLLTVLTAVYLAVRVNFRAALLVLPMCAGAYSACRLGISNVGLRSRIRTAILPTILMTIAFLVSELVVEIATFLVTGQSGTHTTPIIRVGLVIFVLFVYTTLSLIGGTVVGVCVHFCAWFIEVIRLGISARSAQCKTLANQAVNRSRR